jgi:hypothetical protein
VTRSTIFSPIPFNASTPVETAVVAWCATSVATRLTRSIGDLRFVPVGREVVFFVPVAALRFADALREAARFVFALRADLVDRADADRLGLPRFFPARFFDFAAPAFLPDFLARVAMAPSRRSRGYVHV